MFEYINAIGLWKWWKSHKIDRERRILDELADCFAFFLSVLELEEKKGEDFIYAIEDELNDFLDGVFKWKERRLTQKTIKEQLLK